MGLDEGERALAPISKPTFTLARSLSDARPGQVVAVDRHGDVLTPRRIRLLKLKSWAILGAYTGAVGLLYGVGISPVAGAIAMGVTAGLTALQMRNQPAYRTAVALISAQRWEEAYDALRALEGRRLPRGLRDSARVLLGVLESLLGRPEAALARLDDALARIGDRTGATVQLERMRARCVRASILARLGRLDEARRQRAEIVAAPERRGEAVEMLLQNVDLTIAFEADAPGELPDDGTLHDWARAALLRSAFGETLVSLAWAFHRRGDDEMARHLLEEAPSRIGRSSLPTTAPRLHAWATKMLEAHEA